MAAWENPTLDVARRYAFIDWRPEFAQARAPHLPNITNPGLTLSLGARGTEFVRRRKLAAYLPARYDKRYIDAGELHLVPDAPTFPYPVWVVWREDFATDLKEAASKALFDVVQSAHSEQDTVMGSLEAIGQDDVETLGDAANFII